MYNMFVFLNDDLVAEFSTDSIDCNELVAEINQLVGIDNWNRMELAE